MKESDKVFISHDFEDIDEIDFFTRSLEYLPCNRTIVVNKPETGDLIENIREHLSESNILVPYLTENSFRTRWVNQEIGFAASREIPIIPLFEKSNYLKGFTDNVEGVKIRRDEPYKTIHELLTRIRQELTQSGGDLPNWYININCIECDEVNIFPINKDQDYLWRMHEHGEHIQRYCTSCGGIYRFEPASLLLHDVELRDD